MTVSRRGFIGAIGTALAVVALPTSEWTSGWVKLVVPGPPRLTALGVTITPDVIRQMVTNFYIVPPPNRPLPVDINFHGPSWCGPCVGWIEEIRLKGDVLEGRLEIAPEHRHYLAEHKAIVPAFITNWRSSDGVDRGARLVAAALTNTPAVPGTEL